MSNYDIAPRCSRALFASKRMMINCTGKDCVTHAGDETFKIMFNGYSLIVNGAVDKKMLFNLAWIN